MNVITCNRWDVFEEVKKVVKDAYVFIDTNQNSIIYMKEGNQALFDTCWVILEKLGLISSPIDEINSDFTPPNHCTTYINERILNKTY